MTKRPRFRGNVGLRSYRISIAALAVQAGLIIEKSAHRNTIVLKCVHLN
jgi:hypothetical protein